jgi:hypothetical protein
VALRDSDSADSARRWPRRRGGEEVAGVEVVAWPRPASPTCRKARAGVTEEERFTAAAAAAAARRRSIRRSRVRSSARPDGGGGGR